jgi:hypothetical protein
MRVERAVGLAPAFVDTRNKLYVIADSQSLMEISDINKMLATHRNIFNDTLLD